MKISLFFASLIASAVLSSAAFVPVDDPPPEPANCPLCGGNAGLHARVVIELENLQARLLAYALRW